MKLENRGSLLTYKQDGEDCCVGYLFDFTGHGWFDAVLGMLDVTKEEADEHNRQLDLAMLTGLDESCEVGQGGDFYVTRGNGCPYLVTTFVGIEVGRGQVRKGTKATIRLERKGKVYEARLPRGDNQHIFLKRVE